MTLREFTDGLGKPWRVWDTRPATGRVREAFRDGWLTFEHGGEHTTRRRLAPIPERWDQLPEDELRRLCVAASSERPRRHQVQ